jgi:hypothetical protein
VNMPPVPSSIVPNGAFLGEIDRNWTSSNTFGGSAQITHNKIFEHDNHFVMGMSIDGARLSAGDALFRSLGLTGRALAGARSSKMTLSGTQCRRCPAKYLDL